MEIDWDCRRPAAGVIVSGMKREYLIALVLLAGAIFLVFQIEGRGGGGEGSDQESREGRSQGAAPSGGSGGNDRSPGTTRSRRVSRDRPSKIVTDSGLVYQVLQEGEGDPPGPESQVKVHYVGTLPDGTVFDSSRERGEFAVFSLNSVIRGWTEGLQLMRPGARYLFEIPPALAYGEAGAGETIPPNATLTFEIELLSVESP